MSFIWADGGETRWNVIVMYETFKYCEQMENSKRKKIRHSLPWFNKTLWRRDTLLGSKLSLTCLSAGRNIFVVLPGINH